MVNATADYNYSSWHTMSISMYNTAAGTVVQARIAKKPNPYETLIIPPEGLVLQPGRLYLGRTVEYTRTQKYVPMLEGRSSIGRLGLCVHVTAGFGDIGFSGYWTLEIHAVSPIRVYPEIEICQIYYHTVDGDFVPYRSGKYQNNQGIQPSLSWRDFEK